jgi:hypothetical protein
MMIEVNRKQTLRERKAKPKRNESKKQAQRTRKRLRVGKYSTEHRHLLNELAGLARGDEGF